MYFSLTPDIPVCLHMKHSWSGWCIIIRKFCTDNITICECKWSRNKIGIEAVNKLLEAVNEYPNKQNHTLQPVLIAAAGVTKNVISTNKVKVLTIKDLF